MPSDKLKIQLCLERWSPAKGVFKVMWFSGFDENLDWAHDTMTEKEVEAIVAGNFELVIEDEHNQLPRYLAYKKPQLATEEDEE